MLLLIKPGVRVRGLSNEILLAVIAAKAVYDSFEQNLTLTSITDGRHKEGSLHYTGEAVDLRLPHCSTGIDIPLAERITLTLREQLGASYDVVLEKDHIHVEYDPK